MPPFSIPVKQFIFVLPRFFILPGYKHRVVYSVANSYNTKGGVSITTCRHLFITNLNLYPNLFKFLKLNLRLQTTEYRLQATLRFVNYLLENQCAAKCLYSVVCTL